MPDELHELVAAKKVIPFVGAGFSAVAGFPGWEGLLRTIFERLHPPGPPFAEVFESCNRDPLRVAEYLLIKSGGRIGHMRQEIAMILQVPQPFVSSAHIDLVNLRLPAVYTTNFDELIEATFALLGVPVDVVRIARDLAMARTGNSQVIKFHGDVRFDETLVLTESSFYERLDFESPLDLKFRGDALGRSLLFIGYGFGDINVRVLWSKLSNLMDSVPIGDRPPSFIVRIHPDQVLETLDRAAGLTTVVLDPDLAASTPTEVQALVERFMLDLTYAADRAPAPEPPPLPVCSPALISTAIDVVEQSGESLSASDVVVLDAVASRRMMDFVRSDADQLLGAFLNRKPRGDLAQYRKSVALNYAMTFGPRVDDDGSVSDGSD